jgi:hypothetical protein
LRDTGGVKTALTQYARAKDFRKRTRKQIIDSINETTTSSAQRRPDAPAVAQALIQFIEKPGSTLTITVTPKAK